MKIPLSELKPNPFRDFTLYPLDEEQVQRLRQSIDELGFFAGVAARKNGSGYELAAGHHRVEAARRAGLTKIEASVEKYTDTQMVALMAKENLTQVGHNAASVLDSVAAYARLISREVLLGEGLAVRYLTTNGKRGRGGVSLARMQLEIAADGPGKRQIYRAINGFDLKDLKEQQKADTRSVKAETLSVTKINQTLAALKSSGDMARIVGIAHAEVEAIRVERDAAAKAKAEAAAAAAAEEAAKAQTEAEAKAIAQVAAAEAEAAAKAEQAEAERRQREREAIAAQSAKDALYDIRCGNVFRLTNHEATFREGVTSENGLRFIPFDRQLDLAKAVREQIDALEQKRNHDLGSTTIANMVGVHITDAIKAQREIEDAEKQALLQASAVERVEEKWKQLTAALVRAEGFLQHIVNEEREWEYAANAFPMDVETLEKIAWICSKLTELQAAFDGTGAAKEKGQSHATRISN